MEAILGKLGGAVVREATAADLTSERCDSNNVARVTFNHGREELTDRPEVALSVNRHDLACGLLVGVQEEFALNEACIIDEDVDGAESALTRLLCNIFDHLAICHIKEEHLDVLVLGLRLDHSLRLLRALFIDIDNCHLAAESTQTKRHEATETAGGAGKEHMLALDTRLEPIAILLEDSIDRVEHDQDDGTVPFALETAVLRPVVFEVCEDLEIQSMGFIDLSLCARSIIKKD